MPEVQSSGGGLPLGRVASHRFIQVREDGKLEVARALLAEFPKAFLLVRGMEGGYRLLSAAEAEDLLAGAAETTVGEALSAAGVPPVPALEAATDFEEAPGRCVVLENGEPAGFYDIDLEIPEVLGSRGVDELLPRMLVAEMERRVPRGRTVSLLVSLADLELAGEDGIPLALPSGSAVDLYVTCRRGFELEGEREARLVVTGEPRTLPARFLLRAVEPGLGEIELLAFHGTSCLGRLTLAPLVVESGLLASPGAPSTRHESELALPGSRPDLELVIQEVGSPLKPELLIRFRRSEAGAEVRVFGPIPLGLDPPRYFEDFFRDIEALEGEDGPARETAERRLASRGADLFTTILPEDLQVLLWSLRGRIRTLRIESQEPWIPWELCRLAGRQGGRIVEGNFFCEQFAMTRWLLGLKPRTELRLRRIGLIAPKGAGLQAAEAECEERLGITREGVRVESLGTRYLEVYGALACGEYDGFHFAGHGGFSSSDADRALLELEDGELRPWDVSGIACNLGRSSPLVFLNACRAGRAGISLTGMGGWAPRFLGAGASAFVGPYWSVRDRAAASFARAFYRELLAGEPIGEAGRKARLEVRRKHPGNPTWLAYTVYADPLARLID